MANSSQFSKVTLLGDLCSHGAISVSSLVNAAGSMQLSDASCRKLSTPLRFSSCPSISD